MATEPLAPCPFDGGQGEVRSQLRGGCRDGEPDAWAHHVACLSCAAVGPWVKSTRRDDCAGAVAAWNHRVALQADPARHTVVVYRDLAPDPNDRFHLETGLSLAAVRARLRAFTELGEDRKQLYAVPGDPITELDT